jgi:cell division protein FtsL
MRHDKKQPRRINTLAWVFCLMILTAELFAFTWYSVQSTALSYALTQAKDEHNRLLSLEKKLRIERAHLLSPDRITALAQQDLGLQMPEQNQILTLR